LDQPSSSDKLFINLSIQFHSCITGGKDIIIGNYGPAWKFHRKLFMAAIRQYLSDQQLVEERIFEQAGRLLQYFEDQNGKDFDPACILMESVANVIGRITFGKYFDSSHPDFEELLQLNIKGFTDTKTNAQNFVLDFFPAAKYFPFPSYQSVQKLVGRIFEILRHQLKIQENDFDPTAKIDSLTGSLLKREDCS